MSITDAMAKSASDAQLAILTAADNTIFIAAADQQIAQAIDLGQYQISATTWGHVRTRDIYDHYHDLGYLIYFPDEPLSHNISPSELFGTFWEAWWNNTLFLANVKAPCRIIISWKI